MVGNAEGAAGAESLGNENQVTRKLQPVLFIGIGGTGMEVILRVRRRILHANWGAGGQTRIDSLEAFPVAEFLHFDMDHSAVLEGDRSAVDDPLAELVKLPQQDRIVTTLDPMKYLRSEDDLNKYPHIEAWCPLTGEIVKDLNLVDGAGQLRAVSRLYFYDVYPTVRDNIQQKLNSLKANRSNQAQLDRLGLKVDNARVRIVVVGSCAGGTGSGSFLDFGWLAKVLATKIFGGGNYDVQLMLFTPRGYEKANADRTKANGYAALMELETCMNKFPQYVGCWDNFEGPQVLDHTPFTDVYLIESANMGRDALKDVQDVYEMTADALFEDFASEDFASSKRSASVNQKQHKAVAYNPPLPADYGATMRLSYCMGYSAFGQSIMDTKQSQQQDQDEYCLAAAMLEAFFGIASTDKSALQATDQKRDDFMREHLKLSSYTFSQFPNFGNKSDLQNLCAPFVDNQLVLDLLHDDHGGIEEAIQQKLNALVEGVKADQGSLKDWARLLREKIPALEQDVIRNQDTMSITCEERITNRGKELRAKKYTILHQKLYEYLDNRDYGGLEYVLSLSELIKTAFASPTTGLALQLEENAQRYRKIRDALKTNQIEETLNNVANAVKGSFLSGPDIKKASMYLDDLKQDLGDYLRFHARSVAATTGADVLRELTTLIGGKHGTDDKNEAIYSGLLAEFHAGRRDVLAVSKEITRTSKTIEDSKDKVHANYIYIEAETTPQELPEPKLLRTWANEAFKDFEGSQKIFPMLRSADGKAKLLNKLRMRAAHARLAQQAQSPQKRQDPLVRKLMGMDPSTRMSKFTEFLKAAMPWIDANFADVPLRQDRFKCFMGVMNPEDWQPMLDELHSCIPTYAGITATQFQLKKTGISGRAVCYCEISGFPLSVLTGLGDWRTKYRLESKRWPLHTHKDPTLFVHPMVPTPLELKHAATDIRLFLLAVMLRKLVRNHRKTTPPGLYQLDFGRGDWKNLGNERSFRLDGLPSEFRPHVENAVNKALDELDPLQLQALAHLAEYFQRETYSPATHTTERGKDEDRPGFVYGVAAMLHAELTKLARNRRLTDGDLRLTETCLAEWGEGWADVTRSFEKWTEIVPDSNLDAIPWEVKPAEPNGADRCKRRVRKEFFDTGWLRSLCVGAEPMQGLGQGIPPITGFIAPPPLSVPEWWVAVNMQQSGPYDFASLRTLVGTGQLALTTQVWKPGLPAWLPASQVPELACLFMAPPPLGMTPPPL
ncbi:MAG: tubulin-like doman-containing protein [Humidesulfovibrio sp.]|nr:tubulin-like doman-containing protein [Humidesulfovibrio sp.]